MAMYIASDECISCGDCEPVCPTGSIFEGKLAFRIDRKSCAECLDDHHAPKCVDVCPIEGCILHLAA